MEQISVEMTPGPKTGQKDRLNLSQDEIREKYQERFSTCKINYTDLVKEYKEALANGLFDDQEGEEIGSGEKRKKAMQKRLVAIVDKAEDIKKKLDSGEGLTAFQEEISASYTRADKTIETISLNIEEQISDFISFYQKFNIILPPDFSEFISDIWERHHDTIQSAVEQNGFNALLIIPEGISLTDLTDKMKMEQGYCTGANFDKGGGLAGVVDLRLDQNRIILYHKKILSQIQVENGLDVHLNITAGEALEMFEQNPAGHMTLEDFIIMENKIFTENQIHISDYTKKSGQWLATKSGSRLVDSFWRPDGCKLDVDADELGFQDGGLGVRPSRCFY